QRESSAHGTCDGEWVERLSVPGTKHRAIVDPVRRAQPRRKQRFADLDAKVHGIVADAAEPDGIGRDVQQFDTAILAAHQRIVFVAHTQVDRQLLVGRPAVRYVGPILVFTAAQLFELLALVETGDLPHQEPGITIPVVAGVAGRTGNAAAEREDAAWITHLGL